MGQSSSSTRKIKKSAKEPQRSYSIKTTNKTFILPPHRIPSTLYTGSLRVPSPAHDRKQPKFRSRTSTISSTRRASSRRLALHDDSSRAQSNATGLSVAKSKDISHAGTSSSRRSGARVTAGMGRARSVRSKKSTHRVVAPSAKHKKPIHKIKEDKLKPSDSVYSLRDAKLYDRPVLRVVNASPILELEEDEAMRSLPQPEMIIFVTSPTVGAATPAIGAIKETTPSEDAWEDVNDSEIDYDQLLAQYQRSQDGNLSNDTAKLASFDLVHLDSSPNGSDHTPRTPITPPCSHLANPLSLSRKFQAYRDDIPITPTTLNGSATSPCSATFPESPVATKLRRPLPVPPTPVSQDVSSFGSKFFEKPAMHEVERPGENELLITLDSPIQMQSMVAFPPMMDSPFSFIDLATLEIPPYCDIQARSPTTPLSNRPTSSSGPHPIALRPASPSTPNFSPTKQLSNFPEFKIDAQAARRALAITDTYSPFQDIEVDMGDDETPRLGQITKRGFNKREIKKWAKNVAAAGPYE